MNSTRITTLIMLFTAAVSSGPLQANQMPDSHGANTYVKSISIQAIKPYPVIVVKSDGKEYTHVANTDQKKTFNARVSGQCTNIAHVDFASYNLNKTKYNGGDVAHKQLDTSGPWHKTFATNKWVNIQWKPDNSVNNRAVQACRDYMQNAKSQGKSLLDILGEDKRIVVDSGVYGNFNLNCAGNLGLSGGVKHRFDMQPMEVVCEGSPAKLALELNKAVLFKINQINFQPQQPGYTGICPKDFNFNGYVKTNGEQGKFRYRFRNHHGVTGNWTTVQGQKGQSLYAVNHTIMLQDIQLNENPGLPNQVNNPQGNGMAPIPQMGIKENPWVTLEVQNLSNQKSYNRKASYKYTCTQPPKMQLSLNNGNNPDNGKPDLIVLADTFRLGSQTATGNSLVIGVDEATRKVAGLCQFRMQYRIRNQGDAMAQPLFGTRVSKGNVTLHIANTPKLDKGQTRNLSGNLKLASGNNLLLIKTDHADKVDESSEGNNLARIMVTVKGDCGSNNHHPPRPAGPTGAPARRIR